MKPIPAKQAKFGKWYELCNSPYRLYCFKVEPARSWFIEQEEEGNSFNSFNIRCYSTARVTPLPECTGWDWKPEHEYRPFILREMIDNRYRTFIDKETRREARLQGIELKECETITYSLSGYWHNADSILDKFVFPDGTPCGVKV